MDPRQFMAIRDMLRNQGVPVNDMNPTQVMSAFEQMRAQSAGSRGPQAVGDPTAPPTAVGPPRQLAGALGPRPMPPPRQPSPVTPPPPTRPGFNPHRWANPQTMSPSALSVANASPRANADPAVAAGMAEERAARGITPEGTPLPPPVTPPRTDGPPVPRARPGTRQAPPAPNRRTSGAQAAAPSQRQQVAQMANQAFGEDQAKTVKDVPEWALPLMMAGFTAMANSDKSSAEALGAGGQAFVNTLTSERQRKADEGRANRAEGREDRRLDMAAEGLGMDREQLEMSRTRLNSDIENARKRLGLDEIRVGLEGQRVGIAATNAARVAEHQAWQRAFSENEVGRELQQYRDNLNIKMAELGIRADQAEANSNYLAALTAQAGNSTRMKELEFLLDYANRADPSAQGNDEIVKLVGDIVSGPAAGIMSPEEMSMAIDMAIGKLEERGIAPTLVSPDELR